MEQYKAMGSKPYSREKTPAVSVLMTVYNEEAFIRKAIDSVLAQTWRDLELVVVDDASTDASQEILAEYAGRDSRVKVWHNTKNQGLIDSRIRAQKLASGEYTMIVDADDFISKDAISSALQAMEQTGAESAVMRLYMYYSEEDIRPYSTAIFPTTISGKEAFILSVEGKLHGLCLEKREHYDTLPFDNTCRLYSDDNTARLHYYISKKVCFCKGQYYYRQHASSETHRVAASRFDYIVADMSLRQQLLNIGGDRQSLAAVEIHRWKNIVAHHHLLHNNRQAFTPQEQRNALDIIGKAIKSIDFSLLPQRLKARPPYWPTHTLAVFELWQYLYLSARKIFRALRPKHTST